MTAADRSPPLSLLDGTLVELAETPDAIRVPGALRALLERLARRLDGRLAIVSGRAIGDLDRHVGLPGFTVSGSHGLELRSADGTMSAPAPAASLDAARAAITAFAADRPGLLVEEKPASIALHYRRAPDREPEVAAFMA